MTNSTVLAFDLADRWHGFWRGDIGDWILDRGLRIALLLIGGLLAARFINWAANRIVRRIDADYQESDQLVRSESAKHRQAVASVISWVSVALLFVIVAVQVTDILADSGRVAGGAGRGARRRARFRRAAHRAGPAEPGSSSSPRSSTASATWFS